MGRSAKVLGMLETTLAPPDVVILDDVGAGWQITVGWHDGVRVTTSRDVKASVKSRMAALGERWKRGEHDELRAADGRLIAVLHEPAWIGAGDAFAVAVHFDREADAMLAKLALSAW